MKTALYFRTLVFISLVFLLSCTKDDPNLPSTNQNTVPTPSFGDGYGVLAAVQTTTYVTVAGVTIPTELNTAAAAFPESAGSTKYVDAGEVTLNGKPLTKYDNNTYLYDNLLSPITFGTLNWIVTGKGNVPAVNATLSKSMPMFSGFGSLPVTLTKSKGTTINLAGQITGADSVYVLVVDMAGATIVKREAGNTQSVTFSTTDLKSMATGQGMIEIVPWNYSTQTFSSKKFYFVNEAAYVKAGVAIN